MSQGIEEIYIKPDIVHLEVEVNLHPYESPEDVFKVKPDLKDQGIPEDNGNKPEAPSNKKIEVVGKVYANGKINRLKCQQCEATFKNRANLKQHLKFVHSTDNDVVECEKCFRTFKSIGHLRSHVHSVHVEEKNVNCEQCGKVFVSKKRLYNHIFYAHPKPEESVHCTICSKEFKRRYNLKIHMRLVHPSEEQAMQCPHCDKIFKVGMLLQRHIKWSHPPDGMVYRCLECARILPSIACLKKHMENVHTGSKGTACSICLKKFKTDKSLKRHETMIHGDKKVECKPPKVGDLPCPHCDRKFTTNTALFWHFELSHSENKKSNTCQICMKELSDSNGLKRHLEMVHSLESASCPICSKTFKSHMNLERHLQVTHAPPEAAQNCDICNKTFKCSMHLRIHINTVHSKEGTITCDICNKEFSSKKYMLKHKKTHVDVKEFPCSICSKLFKSVNDVKKHTKRVHMKEKRELNCVKCGNRFTTESELHDHILNCSETHVISCVKVEMEYEDHDESEIISKTI